MSSYLNKVPVTVVLKFVKLIKIYFPKISAIESRIYQKCWRKIWYILQRKLTILQLEIILA